MTEKGMVKFVCELSWVNMWTAQSVAQRGRKRRQPSEVPRRSSTAKDIMHVGAVLSPSTEPRDVKLAQLSLLWQFDVMAKIAVVSLE